LNFNSLTSINRQVETLLDLKQKQANVDEAKMARWQAEETQNQSRSLMVFTIFTVMYDSFNSADLAIIANILSFLPLSFFTSLFGMNAREWSDQQTNLPLGEMFAIAGTTDTVTRTTPLLRSISNFIS
jgi:hypothetical protein